MVSQHNGDNTVNSLWVFPVRSMFTTCWAMTFTDRGAKSPTITPRCLTHQETTALYVKNVLDLDTAKTSPGKIVYDFAFFSCLFFGVNIGCGSSGVAENADRSAKIRASYHRHRTHLRDPTGGFGWWAENRGADYWGWKTGPFDAVQRDAGLRGSVSHANFGDVYGHSRSGH